MARDHLPIHPLAVIDHGQSDGRALRVLLLCHEYPPIGGGAAAVCSALAKEYAEVSAAPTVVTMAMDDLPAQERVDGIPVFRVPCGRQRKEMASPWEGLVWAHQAFKLVRELHSREPFDVTHAHFIMPAGIVAARLKRSSKVPFIVTAHGSDVPGYNRERLKLAHLIVAPWWRRICKQADYLVSPSASLLESIHRNVQGIRALVVPNGFQPGRFRPLDKQRRILLCSRLVERKGFQYFLAAMAGLDLAGWSIDIVGDGPMLANLKELAGRCSIPVRFHGWIDNNDPRLADLYGRAMIFAFPSEWENFSIALLEGMSAGCAVITTNISGNPEVIGDTGYLLRPRDSLSLRNAVRELTSDAELCMLLGDAAAVRARELFSWQQIGSRYMHLLNHLVPGKSIGIPDAAAAVLPSAHLFPASRADQRGAA